MKIFKAEIELNGEYVSYSCYTSAETLMEAMTKFAAIEGLTRIKEVKEEKYAKIV